MPTSVLKSKIRSSFARAGMPCSLSSSAPRPMRIRSKNFPISPTHEPATPIIFPDCIGTRGQTTWPERYATFGEDLRRNDIEQRLQNRTVCNVTATDSYLARRWLSLVQKFIPITDDYLWIDGAELNERPSEFSPPPSFGPKSSISSASFHAALFPFHLLVVWVVPMPKRGCFMPCTRVDHCWLLPDRRRNGGLALIIISTFYLD